MEKNKKKVILIAARERGKYQLIFYIQGKKGYTNFALTFI